MLLCDGSYFGAPLAGGDSEAVILVALVAFRDTGLFRRLKKIYMGSNYLQCVYVDARSKRSANLRLRGPRLFNPPAFNPPF